MSKRKNWIDGLRGLAMLFVIYGHILMAVRPYSLFTGLPISLGICTLLCGVCALCSLLVNRYLPFLAGKRRMKA